MPSRAITRGHLTLTTTDAPAPGPVPKQHPEGVWDMPAAVGYRRIAAVDANGNLAIELNLTDRIPEPVRLELTWAVERALVASLQALKL